MKNNESERIPTSEEEWRERLSPEQYAILRGHGTERPFSGTLLYENREGDYCCAGCGLPLFPADTKFDAGCGWPSFYQALPNAIRYLKDSSHGMSRTEIRCARCDGHLGHVFNDGPAPSGQRYCLNSRAMTFIATDGSATQG
ncbi:peptide-methionine (R)-S-oxide reductase MsrB [Aliidiomarina indica]|uniref:peptide-methionine (R)-S-oxide reductase MsrB n=1 Tax=Aliidiomarina indica TaxID=2749147 RepID=UPI00188DCFF7|nr:peptide-methionine (R)-S-oxide reductase MsrB [Aliidiomarina indica]